MKQNGQALEAHQDKIKTLEDEINLLEQSDPERNPKPAPMASSPVPDKQP
jgi:hypothetical protein